VAAGGLQVLGQEGQAQALELEVEPARELRRRPGAAQGELQTSLAHGALGPREEQAGQPRVQVPHQAQARPAAGLQVALQGEVGAAADQLQVPHLEPPLTQRGQQRIPVAQAEAAPAQRELLDGQLGLDARGPQQQAARLGLPRELQAPRPAVDRPGQEEAGEVALEAQLRAEGQIGLQLGEALELGRVTQEAPGDLHPLGGGPRGDERGRQVDAGQARVVQLGPALEGGRAQGALQAGVEIEAEGDRGGRAEQRAEGVGLQAGRVPHEVHAAVLAQAALGEQPAAAHAGLERLEPPDAALEPAQGAALLEDQATGVQIGEGHLEVEQRLEQGAPGLHLPAHLAAQPLGHPATAGGGDQHLERHRHQLQAAVHRVGSEQAQAPLGPQRALPVGHRQRLELHLGAVQDEVAAHLADGALLGAHLLEAEPRVDVRPGEGAPHLDLQVPLPGHALPRDGGQIGQAQAIGVQRGLHGAVEEPDATLALELAGALLQADRGEAHLPPVEDRLGPQPSAGEVHRGQVRAGQDHQALGGEVHLDPHPGALPGDELTLELEPALPAEVDHPEVEPAHAQRGDELGVLEGQLPPEAELLVEVEVRLAGHPTPRAGGPQALQPEPARAHLEAGGRVDLGRGHHPVALGVQRPARLQAVRTQVRVGADHDLAPHGRDVGQQEVQQRHGAADGQAEARPHLLPGPVHAALGREVQLVDLDGEPRQIEPAGVQRGLGQAPAHGQGGAATALQIEATAAHLQAHLPGRLAGVVLVPLLHDRGHLLEVQHAEALEQQVELSALDLDALEGQAGGRAPVRAGRGRRGQVGQAAVPQDEHQARLVKRDPIDVQSAHQQRERVQLHADRGRLQQAPAAAVAQLDVAGLEAGRQQLDGAAGDRHLGAELLPEARAQQVAGLLRGVVALEEDHRRGQEQHEQQHRQRHEDAELASHLPPDKKASITRRAIEACADHGSG